MREKERDREQPLEQAGSGVPFHVIALIAIQLRNWQKHQFHAAAEQSSSAAPLRNQPTTMGEVEREGEADSVCVQVLGKHVAHILPGLNEPHKGYLTRLYTI